MLKVYSHICQHELENSKQSDYLHKLKVAYTATFTLWLQHKGSNCGRYSHFFALVKLVDRPLVNEKNSAKKKDKKKTRRNKDKVSFCTAVRQMLISQVLPNSNKID